MQFENDTAAGMEILPNMGADLADVPASLDGCGAVWA